MARQVSTRALELIKEFELLKLKSYQGKADRQDIYTIGYGHVITGHEVPDLFRPGQMMKDVVITQERAEQLLVEDIQKAVSGVQMRLSPEMASKLNEDQFGALVSLTYNIGVGNFGISAVKTTINGGRIDDAAEGFRSFIRSAGEIRNGLIRRRAAEKALYKSDYDTMTYFLNNSTPAAINKARTYLDLGA